MLSLLLLLRLHLLPLAAYSPLSNSVITATTQHTIHTTTHHHYTPSIHPTNPTTHHHDTQTLEDVYGALALYYDVPSLSMRNAFLNRLGGGAALEAADAGGTALMSFDGLHPNDHGHQVMADAVVWLLQSAAVGLALRPPDAAERAYVERGALPEPMYPGG